MLPASRSARSLFSLLMLAALAACGDAAAPQPRATTPPPAAVGVITLHPRDVPLTVELPGRVNARLLAEIRPQVSGVIRERAFREGGEVKAGDTLYLIDAAPYQAAYDNAVAGLGRAQAAVPAAKGKLERYGVLIRQNIVSQQAMEDTQAAYTQAQQAVKVAEADVARARIDLERTRILAPISGRIDKSSVTPGALVTASQANALTTIRALDPINVEVTQSSRQMLALRADIASGRITASPEAVPVRLKLEDGTLYDQPGRLDFTEANVSETTGTVSLGAVFPNPRRVLLPGTYVRAILEQGSAPNAYLVPQRAVARNIRGEATAWFIGPDDKPVQRVLAVESAVGNNWLVTQGISPGERIAVDGLQSIRPDVPVKPVGVRLDEATGEVKQTVDVGKAG